MLFMPDHLQLNSITQIQKVVKISSRIKTKSCNKKLCDKRPACIRLSAQLFYVGFQSIQN